jgi:hypothetical protein
MTVRRGSAVVAAVTGLWGLACVGVAEGERMANGGACPAGEVCVEEHGGLLFTGQVFYDDQMERLGPVLVGGTFRVSFASAGKVPMRAFEVVTEPGLQVEEVNGGRVTLSGVQTGPSYLRVVDRETGALYDRLLLDVVQIESVSFDNVTEPGRPVLYAGCEEMIGIELLASGGGASIRAFDQNVDLEAPGGVEADPFVWDCFRYVVPVDRSEVTFTVRTGDQVFEQTVSIEEPPPEGCPVPPSSD